MKHYVAARSRAQADAIARTASRKYPGRVWIEGDQSASGREHVARLSPETVDREIERLDPRVRLTPEQQGRRDAALAFADAQFWQKASWLAAAPGRPRKMGSLVNMHRTKRAYSGASVAGAVPSDASAAPAPGDMDTASTLHRDADASASGGG
jgi:hypothetical protein